MPWGTSAPSHRYMVPFIIPTQFKPLLSCQICQEPQPEEMKRSEYENAMLDSGVAQDACVAYSDVLLQF